MGTTSATADRRGSKAREWRSAALGARGVATENTSRQKTEKETHCAGRFAQIRRTREDVAVIRLKAFAYNQYELADLLSKSDSVRNCFVAGSIPG